MFSSQDNSTVPIIINRFCYTYSRIAGSSFINSLERVEGKLQEHLKVNAILVPKLKKE
jgi:hypothetical protein